MRVGCHVSIAGSVDRAVDNAVERGCTAFQIFTRNPRSWHAKELTDRDVSAFREKVRRSGIDRAATVAHMPYLPNLATPDAGAFEKSVGAIVGEVGRCDRLGIPYLVTHLGSHLGTGEEAGIARLAGGLERAAEASGGVTILLENTAGQKNSVGSDFGQWGEILSRLRPRKRFGVCLDTCHAFAAGYDLRTPEAVRETFARLDRAVGLDRLKVLHLNDSRGELGSNLDRHYHVGLGSIGGAGMGEVARTADARGIPIIMETPIDEVRTDFDNMRAVKELARAGAPGRGA